MSRAHARTWWDDSDDAYGESLWVVPSRADRRPALRALPGGGDLRPDRPARPPARAARRATDRRTAPARRGAASRRSTAADGDQKPGSIEERLAGLVGDRPDRIGLWAPMLGFFLMAVAAASAHV